MKIRRDKLENLHRVGDKEIARCPACAEAGQDAAGNHLVINPDGSFGCVIHSGEEGKSHRRRIRELAGEDSEDLTPSHLPVRPADRHPAMVPIIEDVLGRLGRVYSPPACGCEGGGDRDRDVPDPVPSVPEQVPPPVTAAAEWPSAPRAAGARGGAVVEEVTEAESLVGWLREAELPAKFDLWPGTSVTDRALFLESLLGELSLPGAHHTFHVALRNARRLQELFGPGDPGLGRPGQTRAT